MKNLSEKFDHLPQDFDREAIWKGIEKPKRGPVFLTYSFISLLLIAAVVSLFFVFTHSNNPVSKPERIDTLQPAKSPEKKSFAKTQAKEQNAYAETAPEKSDIVLSDENNNSTNIPETAQNAIVSEEPFENENKWTEKSEIGLIENVGGNELNSKSQDQILNTVSDTNEEIQSNAELLPGLVFLLKSSQEKTVYIDQKKIPVQQKSARQSLAFRANIGIHGAHFSSSNEEASKWRSDLEKPQLDYGLGFRYEHILRKNFLLSFSAGYHLYKDKIRANYHLRESIDQVVHIDYKLHNHYHVFSGQVEVGKRFFQKEFFWDLQGGAGLKFHQISEVDYFADAGELVDEDQSNSAYQSSTDLFYTAQAAIGKHLNNRLFVRTGTQFNSGINLTATQAGTRHRIIPFNVFVEVGMRF